jgi:predicted RNase H-like nuclease (RuvC/YqgF family)
MEKQIKILTTDELKELLEKEKNEKGKKTSIVNFPNISNKSSSKQLTNKERIATLENKVEVLQKENEELKKEMMEIKQTLQLVLELQLNQNNENFSKKSTNTENKEETFIVQPPKIGPDN